MKTREIILGINPCTYGLNYHDPAIAFIENGMVIYAIEEERINGIKGSKGIFPIESIKAGLDYCDLSREDISGVAIGYNPLLWKHRLTLEINSIIEDSRFDSSNQYDAENIIKRIEASNLINRYSFFKDTTNVENILKSKAGFSKDIPISFYDHHLAHIASSYELSGFDEAVGIVVDGIGEVATTTLWKIQNSKYEKILELDYPNSIGYFYAIATKFLGFTPWCHEGKTMALAAYGHKDAGIQNKLDTILKYSGEVYDVSEFILNNSTDFLMVDEEKALISLEKIFSIPRRKKDEPLTEQYQNFAWAVQNALERSVVSLVNIAVEKTGITNVCAAGGIFMNCKMNMIVREQSCAKKFFVQPLAGDLGLCVGAGLLLSSNKYSRRLNSIDFGPEYSDEQIEAVLREEHVNYIKCEDIANNVANLLVEGKVVCWFQGRMEMGARALGSRSILADPRDPLMSDRINTIVKHREVWRPFACSVLEEYCPLIFENYPTTGSYPFMIEAFKVKDTWTNRIPAVIHKADCTSRPQSVSRETKPLYHKMISYFNELTGCPLVLNTSFNDKGQPIIMTPKLALEFFEKIQVDALAIGSFLITRKNSCLYDT